MKAAHLGCHCASNCHWLALYLLHIILATALKVEAIRAKCTAWVNEHWESFIKVSLKQFRTNDEASGCAFIDAHHYQHTKVGYYLLHEFDVEVPIRLVISLLVCYWFLYRWIVEVTETLLPRLANCRCNRARPKNGSLYRLHRSLNSVVIKSSTLS